jgi:DNA-binding transcriptional regulator LsrR (DeoR family)
MKRAVITLTVFVTVVCLFGCSRKEVYSAEEMTIYRMETETEGKQFYVEMTVPPVQMSEETKEFLLSVEPVTDYTIQLSDGTHYGYHGMEGGRSVFISTLFRFFG